MSLADYMAACLTHPVHGYYVTHDPLGSDFTTAPEVSQMFGECLGLALAAHWAETGAPTPFALAEPGPGRGTLMADALRAGARVPGFAEAAELHLVEVSPVLRAEQARRLASGAPRWLDSLAHLPEAPLFLLANEFFDALPIRQFVRDGAGWRERVIGADGEGLAFGLTDPAPIAALAHRLDDTSDGDLVELCPGAAAATAEIARRIAAYGGAAIIVDYGGWRSLGDTFQALAGGAAADPLSAPGEADLTAHVDFEMLALAATGAGADASEMVPQGVLLERLGVTARANQLAATGEATAIAAAHRRLTHPAEMGDLFKAIAIHPRGQPPPPGFLP
jgi:SAM-dependent MidA family methyltransferase